MRSHLDLKSAEAQQAPAGAQEAPAATNGEASVDTPFGGRPGHHFAETLREAAAAAPSRKLGSKLLVLTHRSPDPDGLGACEGIRRLCGPDGFGYEVDVATVGRIHRAENLAMVRALDLNLLDYNALDLSSYFGCVLVDSQPQFGHTVVPDELPMLAVFDHHVPPSEDAPTVPHQDVRLGVGASSSIVYEYLREVGIELDEKTSSALFCGVRYDTADLSRNSAALDEEAYYETFRRCNRQSIARIAHPVLPRAYYKDLHAALSVARQHGALVVALLNRVSHPEFVAEMADFMLRMKGCSWVLVGGAFEENGKASYVLSLRTDSAFGLAYPLMKRVLDGQGSFGGHGHI
ncbi:MAG: hypothetical protein AAF368_12720, partial [Planctomycetota bacterium]